MKIFFFVLLFYSCLFTLPKRSPIRIPLKLIKQASQKYPIIKEIDIYNPAYSNYKIEEDHDFRSLEQTQHGIVQIRNESFPVAEIKIGSNNQAFDVVLDTGSSILLVPLLDSISSSSIVHYYYPSTSITAENTTTNFSAKYLGAYADGYYFSDSVKFLNQEITMVFGVAMETNYDLLGSDGIMGLARIYSQTNYSFIWSMKSQGLIDNISFSFKYNNDSVEMFVGGEHEDFSKENVASCPLLNDTLYEQNYWACQIYSFSLVIGEKNSTASGKYSAIFDTGTNAFILPYNFIQYNYKLNLEQYDCFEQPLTIFRITSVILCSNISNLPDLFIEIGDYYFNIGKEMYYNVSTVGGDSYFMLNIRFDKFLDTPIIGQPFFRLFHTKFDPENNLLKFYSEDESKIKKSWEKNKKQEKEHTAPTYPNIPYEPYESTKDEFKRNIFITLGFVFILVICICVAQNCCTKKIEIPGHINGINDQLNIENIIPE